MTFKQIANKLNDIALKNQKLGEFQNLRAGLNGFERPRTYKLFSNTTIKEDEFYAFHDGGRSEIQFNIGVEEVNGKDIFRFGLAFSLSPNQTQSNPLENLTPKILAFNSYIKSNKNTFENTILWHYKDKETQGRSKDYPLDEIPNDWIVWSNFIFIGKYIIKELDEINDSDLKNIINYFEEILVIYEFVEGNFKDYITGYVPNKIARICWNDNGWIFPSGASGKSEDEDTFEYLYGYGHEEWLGDISKQIEGFHYSFLQPLNEKSGIYIGKIFNIKLFSINNETKKKYEVGEIKNARIIDYEESEKVKKIYLDNGWLNEMEKQVELIGGTPSGLKYEDNGQLFNIQFDINEIVFNEIYLETNNEEIKNIKRYTLVNDKESSVNNNPLESIVNIDELEETNFDKINTYTSVYERIPKIVEINQLHKKIQFELSKWLYNNISKKLKLEFPLNNGTRIDLILSQDGEIFLYEIKTYNNLKLCVREALGQLIEYNSWTNKNLAKELIIVSHLKVTEEVIEYLSNIRNLFNLPIYYQQFDLKNNLLSEKY